MSYEDYFRLILVGINLLLVTGIFYLSLSILLFHKYKTILPGIKWSTPKTAPAIRSLHDEELSELEWKTSFFNKEHTSLLKHAAGYFRIIIIFLFVSNFSFFLLLKNTEMLTALIICNASLIASIGIKVRSILDGYSPIYSWRGELRFYYDGTKTNHLVIGKEKFPLPNPKKIDIAAFQEGQNVSIEFSPNSQNIWKMYKEI